jgi:hypothetical protein
MSDNGDWSNESDKDTPLPLRLALAARAVLEEMMMETAADFDVASSIFGERSGSKVKRAKGNMARASRVPATPTSSTPAPSTSGTTPLSYASMASPATSSGSRAQATPTPSHQPSPQDSFIGAFRRHVQSFDSSVDHNDPSCAAFFACLAEEVLAFTFVALKNPVLKDRALPPGMCGTSSFEFALSQVIAQTGPPPPTPGQPDHDMPTTPKAARPCPLEVETAVTPQQPKRAKVLYPAPPPIPAAQKKRAPALAVAAPPPSKSLSKMAAASMPLALSAPAPPLSTRACRRHKGRHTDHGMSRCGVKLVPPARSSIQAINVTPDMLWDINKHLLEDVASDIVLEYPMDIKTGIFIAASRVPTSSEVACALKHICRLITIPGVIPIKSKAITLTSFLKVIDVPHIPAEPRVWLTTQRSAFLSALCSSPVSASLDKYIKHAPRFMRTSPHTDTCVVWIDISDSVSGSNARNFIGKQVVIGGRNCQIRGAAPGLVPPSALAALGGAITPLYASPKASGALSVAGRILRPLTKTPASWRSEIPRRVNASTVWRPRKARQRTLQRTLCAHSGTIGSIAAGSSASFRTSQSRDMASHPVQAIQGPPFHVAFNGGTQRSEFVRVR